MDSGSLCGGSLRNKDVDFMVALLYCCPDCPSYKAHLSSIGWATWTFWILDGTTIYSLQYIECVSLANFCGTTN